MAELAVPPVSLEQYAFKWNREQTDKFIRLRGAMSSVFNGGRESALSGYRNIVEQMGLAEQVTPLQARKKWENLKRKYKECKCPASGQGTEDGRPTAASWPWYVLMDEVLGKTAAITPPCLVASLQGAMPGPSQAREAGGERGTDLQDEEQEERATPPPRKRKRQAEGKDEVLDLLKEQDCFLRETEARRQEELVEVREARVRAEQQTDRFLALMEALVKKF